MEAQIATKGDALLKRMEKDSTHDKEKVIYTNEKIRKKDSCVMTQTSPNSKGIMENFGNVVGYKECLDPSQKKLEHRRFEDQNIRQNDDIFNVPSKEEKHQVSVEDDEVCENDKNSSGLMKDVDEQKQLRKLKDVKNIYKTSSKLQELEESTKQLSAVMLNKPKSISMFDILKEENDHKCNRKLMNNDDKSMTYSKNKLKLRPNHVHQMICRKCAKKPLDINYVQTNDTPPMFSIPRSAPKLLVTKIIINLSNLKLLTQNCGSLMTTSITEPLIITDSTEQKRKFINRTKPYELDNKIENRTQLSFRNMDKFKKSRKVIL
ncbi:hypothetical protein HHI36_014799 [Cryptolaemus montrouzieri]|uniref:Uncharacterized protein n=1 Tax=Cryptolaemus montrouzieri TaxID=559131 RepID=A0ABD2N3N1_9CUCU